MGSIKRMTVDSINRLEQDDGGVYLVFFRSGQSLLQMTDFYSLRPAPLLTVDGAPLCYVGSSDSVRRRMRCHMYGDSRKSNLRVTVASILADDLSLTGWATGRARACHFGAAGEDALTKWFKENAIVRFLETPDFVQLEANLIKVLRPPFNIAGLRSDEYARHMMSLRQRFGFSAGLPVDGLQKRTLH